MTPSTQPTPSPPPKPAPRARLEAWLNAQWYGGHEPALALRALVPVYRALRWLDGHVSARKTAPAAALPPIVVIGNLTVGGSGKTPLVLWLIERARAEGLRPAVISRGYGGRAVRANQALRVTENSDWRAVGDEPVLIAKRTGVPVAVCANRMLAALELAAECDLLICDDGLQHRGLTRAAEILVIDGARRFGNQRLLPAGPLREPLPAQLAARFPLRVCNGGAAQVGEHLMRLAGAEAVNTQSGARAALRSFKAVRALAGIGNPERFYSMLASFGVQVHAIPVGDHARLSEPDWQALIADGAPILMTEKDALKYPAHANSWWVPIDAELPEALWQALALAVFPRQNSQSKLAGPLAALD